MGSKQRGSQLEGESSQSGRGKQLAVIMYLEVKGKQGCVVRLLNSHRRRRWRGRSVVGETRTGVNGRKRDGAKNASLLQPHRLACGVRDSFVLVLNVRGRGVSARWRTMRLLQP